MNTAETSLNKRKSGKLPVGTKLAYGSFELAGSLSLVAFLTFGLYFLTDIAGVSPGIAGTILAVGSIVNAVAAPAVGLISDSCKSKYGRRRPFLVAIAIPSGIIFWLFFTDFNLSPTGKVVYFTVIVILYYIIMALMDVPFTSLGAEMTTDYDERTSLNTYRSIFCQVASIISGSFIISIAAYFAGIVGDEKQGWSIMAAIIGAICVLVILNGWRATRGCERHREEQETFSIKDFGHAFKNKTFVYTACLYSAGIGAYTVGMAVQVYFLSDYMQLSERMITVILAIYNIAAILWLPLIPYVSKKYSKRAAWVVMMGIWGLSLVAVFIFVRPENVTALYITTAFGGAGSMVAYTVGWSMLPDCIEIDEYKYGQRKEGMYYGLLSIIQKGSAAVVTLISGFLLEFMKYDVTATVQSDDTIAGIRYMYVFGAIFFLALSYIFVAVYPLTRKKHRILLDAIEAKKSGEDFDISEIKDLVK